MGHACAIILVRFNLLASLWSDALGVTAVEDNHPSNPIQSVRHLAFNVLNLSIDLNCLNCHEHYSARDAAPDYHV